MRQLVNLMDGEIGLESREGKGSTFWFCLWFEKATIKSAEQPLLPVGVRGLRALIVAPSAALRSMLAAHLDAAGLPPVSAPGVAQALAVLNWTYPQEQPVALIVMDESLTGSQVDELLAAARQAGARLLTLRSPMHQAESFRGGEAGGACLLNPPRPAILLQQVAGLLAGFGGKAPAPAAAPLKPLPGKGKRVLLVEDNPTAQRLVADHPGKPGSPGAGGG